jgi:DNA-binding Lrp family transcriptional regulator
MARRKPAAQTPVNSMLLPVDHRLLQALAGYGPRAIYPSVPELARRVGYSPRWVQKRLDYLEAHGHLERVAVYELPGEPDWDVRGRRIEHKGRQTSNTYRLRPEFTPPGELQSAAETPVNSGKTAAQTPVSRQVVSTRISSPLEQPEANHTTVTQEPPQHGEQQDEFTGVADPWPTDASGRFQPVAIGPAITRERERNDGPSRDELLDRLEALGPVQVVQEWQHPIWRNRWGRQVDLETCTPAALHGAVIELLYRIDRPKKDGGK